MAERTESERTESPSRWPDLFTLLVGLATMFAAAYVLTDGQIWVPTTDPRWLLAGGAGLVGLGLLVSSVRGGRRKR
ncbi:hypothetical protein [Actinophytocola sediminis]